MKNKFSFPLLRRGIKGEVVKSATKRLDKENGEEELF